MAFGVMFGSTMSRRLIASHAANFAFGVAHTRANLVFGLVGAAWAAGIASAEASSPATAVAVPMRTVSPRCDDATKASLWRDGDRCAPNCRGATATTGD